jgi:type IV secretory pathway VirB10-like protein
MTPRGTKRKARTSMPAELSREAHSERLARVRLRAFQDKLVSLEGLAKAGLDGLPPDERRSAIESIADNFINAQQRLEAEDMKARRQAEETQEKANRKAADKELKAALEDGRQASQEKAARHEQDMKDRDLAREQRRKKGELESRWEHLIMMGTAVAILLTLALFAIGCIGGHPPAVIGSAVTGSFSLWGLLASGLRSRHGPNRKDSPEPSGIH